MQSISTNNLFMHGHEKWAPTQKKRGQLPPLSLWFRGLWLWLMMSVIFCFHFFHILCQLCEFHSNKNTSFTCSFLQLFIFKKVIINSGQHCYQIGHCTHCIMSMWVMFCCNVVLAAAILYRRLKHYLLTEEQLVENGFPRSHESIAGAAVVSIPQQDNASKIPLSPNCTYFTLFIQLSQPFHSMYCRCYVGLKQYQETSAVEAFIFFNSVNAHVNVLTRAFLALTH